MKKILQIISEFIVGGLLGILLGFIFLVIGSILTANLPSDIEFAGGAGYEIGGFIGSLLGMALGSFLGVWLLERKNRVCSPSKILFCAFGGVLGGLILLKLFADVFQFFNGGLLVLILPLIGAVLGAHQKNNS